MSEHLARLRTAICDLESELASLDTMDADTRRLLEQALEEIQGAIHHDDAAEMEPYSLAAKLQSAAEQLEFSHPTLYGIASRAVDVLGQMGI